jgi:hypothetical protein
MRAYEFSMLDLWEAPQPRGFSRKIDCGGHSCRNVCSFFGFEKRRSISSSTPFSACRAACLAHGALI